MSENKKYISIIGLEIHVELKTNSKMFCGCRNDPFHAAKPNIYTCPVCLGLPGALPVPNKKAIEMTVMAGLALGCRINKESRFDRKHYFYPDLPKGYQISQYEKPFAEQGRLKFKVQSSKFKVHDERTIRIRRVHLEEDTGKLLHRKIGGEEVSLIDFNRSGVPLVEIVTEPDIRSAAEAKAAAQKIQGIVRFLGISDADMEKGSMRLEANVSLVLGDSGISDDPRRHFFGTLGLESSLTASSLPGESKSNISFSSSSMTSKISPSDHLIPPSLLPDYKVELKNINSFRFLEKAINQEIERQKTILSSNKVVKQQTFGWDTEKQELKPQRVKEEAADYRYFPEPDIPPIRFTDREISKFKVQIPKLSEEIYDELIAAGVGEQAAEVISSNKVVAQIAQEVLKGPALPSKAGPSQIKNFGNWLVHHRKEAETFSADELVEMFRKEKAEVVEDEQRLGKWVDEAVAENQKAAADYKKGKEAALQFLIGQVQKKAGGKKRINVIKVIKIIKEKLRL